MSASIHPTAVVLPYVVLAEDVRIEAFAIIGRPYRTIVGQPQDLHSETKVGRCCQIGSFVVIGIGTRIGDDCIVEDGCQVETDVVVGNKSHLLYSARVCNESRIGDGCIIGGFVCERAVIEDYCRVFGQLIHQQLDPTSEWDATEEKSPVLRESSFVGFGAKVIGPVTIGPSAYVCAGAIVTKNVPRGCIAFGVNRICDHSQWRGRLAQSPFFSASGND